MAALPLLVEISMETTMLCCMLDSMSKLMNAETAWERQLYTTALKALAEAQDAGDDARLALGIADAATRHRIEVRLGITIEEAK